MMQTTRRRRAAWMMTAVRLLILAVALGAYAYYRQAQPPVRTPVTLQMALAHSAHSAGFYLADLRGYYAAEGIGVTYREGGPEVEPDKVVAAGEAHFGLIVAEELLVARAAGRPLVALAAIYRRSPIVFFTPTDSGIRQPREFAGKTIRITPGIDVTLAAITARNGVRPSSYRVVVLPTTLVHYQASRADVWGGYATGFALTVQRAGHAVNIIYPDEYGVHFMGEVLFATEQFIATNPDLVHRFVSATIRGWAYAVENPDEAGRAALSYNPDLDEPTEVARMITALPLVNNGEDHIGWMKPEVWETTASTLERMGVLTSPIDVLRAYTLRFMERARREGAP